MKSIKPRIGPVHIGQLGSYILDRFFFVWGTKKPQNPNNPPTFISRCLCLSSLPEPPLSLLSPFLSLLLRTPLYFAGTYPLRPTTFVGGAWQRQ